MKRILPLWRAHHVFSEEVMDVVEGYFVTDESLQEAPSVEAPSSQSQSYSESVQAPPSFSSSSLPPSRASSPLKQSFDKSITHQTTESQNTQRLKSSPSNTRPTSPTLVHSTPRAIASAAQLPQQTTQVIQPFTPSSIGLGSLLSSVIHGSNQDLAPTMDQLNTLLNIPAPPTAPPSRDPTSFDYEDEDEDDFLSMSARSNTRYDLNNVVYLDHVMI